MARARLLFVLGLACACEPSKVVGYGEVDPNVPAPAVYETLELPFESRPLSENPFQRYVDFEFWQGVEHYHVDGFYDGERAGNWTYKVRFMVPHPGEWHYRWSLPDGSDSGTSRISVEPRRDEHIHGHVRVDKTTPTVLWHDDGTVHYWFGGKSFTANNYGPQNKQGQSNQRPPGASAHDDYYSDLQVAAYLQLMKERDHNGTRLKIAQYPLDDDGISWDLTWIRRAEDWIKKMQQQRIYCQITFFDTRARALGKPFEAAEAHEDQVFNAWDPAQDVKTENYIRYIVARFAGYWNVYWEFMNRVDDAVSEDILTQWAGRLVHHDPYDLAIGGSSVPQARKVAAINIEIPRDSRSPAPDSRRTVLLNEMVDTCSDQEGATISGDADTAIRYPQNRLCYRSALWRAFVSGAFGASEASWLDLNPPVDTTTGVIDVMRDHQRLRTIITALGTGINELAHNPGFVAPPNTTKDPKDDVELNLAHNHKGTRAKLGQLYVSYFTPGRTAGELNVRLPNGEYSYRWLDPHDPDPGEPPPIPEPPKTLSVRDNSQKLYSPAYKDDLVLVVERLGD